ncbi:hypothetical protein [Primorskyibacter sedentarius]|uniref:hypothetical protein n=1 Tax=Primorskyibacter sedentarius TaxID=745311 RepID=UPI003EBF6E29
MTEKLSDDRFLNYYHAVTHALACCDGVSREDCELVVSNVMRVTDREIADLERRLEEAPNIAIRLTNEDAARIVDWFDDGLEEGWKEENTTKVDYDLRYSLWLASQSSP